MRRSNSHFLKQFSTKCIRILVTPRVVDDIVNEEKNWQIATKEDIKSFLKTYCSRHISMCSFLPFPKIQHLPGIHFHSRRKPEISIDTYIWRLANAKDIQIPEFTILYAIELISRLKYSHLCDHSVHRIFLVSLLIANKMLHDDLCDNAYWAQLGGISTDEINQLEIYFLIELEFRVWVKSLQTVFELLPM